MARVLMVPPRLASLVMFELVFDSSFPSGGGVGEAPRRRTRRLPHGSERKHRTRVPW